jgi:hypothetical protein
VPPNHRCASFSVKHGPLSVAHCLLSAIHRQGARLLSFPLRCLPRTQFADQPLVCHLTMPLLCASTLQCHVQYVQTSVPLRPNAPVRAPEGSLPVSSLQYHGRAWRGYYGTGSMMARPFLCRCLACIARIPISIVPAVFHWMYEWSRARRQTIPSATHRRLARIGSSSRSSPRPQGVPATHCTPLLPDVVGGERPQSQQIYQLVTTHASTSRWVTL